LAVREKLVERQRVAQRRAKLAQQAQALPLELQASLVCWVKQPLVLGVSALLRARPLVLAPWLATKLCNGAEGHSKPTASHLRPTTHMSRRLVHSKARPVKTMYGASQKIRGRISGNKARSRTSGAEVIRVGMAAMAVAMAVIGVIGSE
jgi:hypothetical protein